jgi:very-short-patch-repair endonuclease
MTMIFPFSQVGESTLNQRESQHTIKFLTIVRALKLPLPTPEHRFDPVRRWRFDWCWLDRKLALEVEGGVWRGGRHTNPIGFVKDIEKYNAATLQGWRVLRCTPQMIDTGEVIPLLEAALKDRA